MTTASLWRFALGALATATAALFPFFQAASQSTPAPQKLSLGIISTESSSELRKGFDPFIDRLSQRLDMPVKAYFATDYAGVIEAMRFNKIQLAWMGNKSAIEAVDRAGAEVFAQTTKANGDQGYHSVIIVRRDSPFQTIDDLLAKREELAFGNGDPNSTSGYLIPFHYLWTPRGINPQSDFKHTRNANHEVNCIAVAMGQIDFATANDEALYRLGIVRPKLAQRLRVVWQSPTIPNDPLVWRKDLPEETKRQIKRAIMHFGRKGPDAAKEREILAGIRDGWGPFLDSDDSQLLPIREIALEKERQSILSNKRLDSDEKATRIQALEARHLELLAAHGGSE